MAAGIFTNARGVPVCEIYLDFEATGRSPRHAEIIEIGACTGRGETFQTYVKPQRGIPPVVRRITGIQPSTVRNAPPFKEAWRSFVEWVTDQAAGAHSVLVLAHNGARYDYPLLRANLERNGMGAPHADWVYGDTLVGMKKCMLKGSLSQPKVYERLFGGESYKAHTALADSEALRRIVEHMAVDTDALLYAILSTAKAFEAI